MDYIEQLIINQLVNNPEYSKNICPFLNINFVNDDITKIFFKKYSEFNLKYKKFPNWENICYEISNDKSIPSDTVNDIVSVLNGIKETKFEPHPIEWLTDTTEKYFQDTALQKAILKGAEILSDDDKKKKERHTLPELMKDALKISFRNTVGKEYGTEFTLDSQYDYYHHKDRKYPFPEWPYFTEVLKGGCAKKKLHLVLGSTSTGKTLYLLNICRQYLLQGLNILYVSLEISEEEILERLDANMLKVNTDELLSIDKNKYFEKLKDIVGKSNGRLVIKEYPTASANVNHLRFLMDELQLKNNFHPDFLIVDYLNILGSVRYSNVGDLYTYVKIVGEELRGLAVEKNIGIWSATQTNRSGFGSSNIELNSVSESWGTAMTVDYLVGITETDDLKQKGQYMMKQLKSRYAPIFPHNEKWIVNVNKYRQEITENINPTEGLAIEGSPPQYQSTSDKFEGFNF